MVMRDTGAVHVMPRALGEAVDRLYESAVAEGYRSIFVSKILDDEMVHLFDCDGGDLYIIRRGHEWHVLEFELVDDGNTYERGDDDR